MAMPCSNVLRCSLVGLQVFWSIALYLGDGGYQIVKMGIISYTHWLMQRRGAAIGEPSLEGKDEKEVHFAPLERDQT